ncbi:MAG: energy-coupling factor transporter transmembrane protein EcfT [Aigarchaeota archaeon]|nr:energy-coupling factor transporter transmembrane protein EcfT [Aigarchaeota archaeon]MDW8092434.1 energy-coupling factor transporter transmembrane component T [Nitrososphaerota archaeon]
MSLSIIQGLKYRDLGTWLHRLDPRVKLSISIYLLALALLYNELYRGILVMSVSIICFIGVLLSTGKVLRPFLYTLRGGLPIVMLVVIIQLLSITLVDPSHLVYSTVAYAVRFIAFISSFTLFFLTTSPDEVGLTLQHLRVPPLYTFTLVMAIKFAPLLADEVQMIIDAQRSRGVEFERGNPIRRLRSLFAVFIPLIVNALRRSYELAEALEVKCFGANEKRTSYRTLKFGRRDALTMGSATVILFALVMVRFSELSINVL